MSGIQILAGRLRHMIGRAVLSLVNDAAKLQQVQVQLQAEVVRDKAEHFQHYGLTSVPHPGAEGIYLAIGGSTDHVVVICIDDRRFRLKNLQPGEVALYDDLGQAVHLTRDGIVINGAGKQVTFLNAPSVDFNVPNVRHNGVEIGSTHRHGNVEPGGGLSGAVAAP